MPLRSYYQAGTSQAPRFSMPTSFSFQEDYNVVFTWRELPVSRSSALHNMASTLCGRLLFQHQIMLMNAGVKHHAFATMTSTIAPISFDQDASQSRTTFLVNAKQNIFPRLSPFLLLLSTNLLPASMLNYLGWFTTLRTPCQHYHLV